MRRTSGTTLANKSRYAWLAATSGEIAANLGIAIAKTVLNTERSRTSYPNNNDLKIRPCRLGREFCVTEFPVPGLVD